MPASDPETVPGLLSVLRLAISDPGSVLPCRVFGDGHYLERESDWAARAVARAIGPFLVKPAKHDPMTDCNCEPGAPIRCEYRQLADAVGEAFNPRDDEMAEVAILADAVNQARDALAAIPCSCTPEMVEDWDQCQRCAALGQRDGRPVQR
jgi:hypothetical protein